MSCWWLLVIGLLMEHISASGLDLANFGAAGRHSSARCCGSDVISADGAIRVLGSHTMVVLGSVNNVAVFGVRGESRARHGSLGFSFPRQFQHSLQSSYICGMYKEGTFSNNAATVFECPAGWVVSQILDVHWGSYYLNNCNCGGTIYNSAGPCSFTGSATAGGSNCQRCTTQTCTGFNTGCSACPVPGGNCSGITNYIQDIGPAWSQAQNCLGQNSCTLQNLYGCMPNGTDPCYGSPKFLTIEAICTSSETLAASKCNFLSPHYGQFCFTWADGYNPGDGYSSLSLAAAACQNNPSCGCITYSNYVNGNVYEYQLRQQSQTSSSTTGEISWLCSVSATPSQSPSQTPSSTPTRCNLNTPYTNKFCAEYAAGYDPSQGYSTLQAAAYACTDNPTCQCITYSLVSGSWLYTLRYDPVLQASTSGENAWLCLLPSSTETASESPSVSETPTHTSSPSETESESRSSTTTASISETSTPSQSVSASPTATASETPSATVSRSTTNTESSSRTPSTPPSLTPSATASSTSTATPSRSPTTSESVTPSSSGSRSYSSSRTGTRSSTGTRSTSASQTPSKTPSTSHSLSKSTSFSASLSITRTSSISSSASKTPSLSQTASVSMTLSASSSLTASQTTSLTRTATVSGPPTSSSTASLTSSRTRTQSATLSPTTTTTASATPSTTQTASATPSTTKTASATPSLTQTATATVSHTGTATTSSSPSSTNTASASNSPSTTSSGSFTASPSETASPTTSPAAVSISHGGTVVLAGNSTSITATLNRVVTTSVTVTFQYSGSAVRNTDYTVPSTVLTIPAGSLSATLTISCITTQPFVHLTVYLSATVAFAEGTSGSIGFNLYVVEPSSSSSNTPSTSGSSTESSTSTATSSNTPSRSNPAASLSRSPSVTGTSSKSQTSAPSTTRSYSSTPSATNTPVAGVSLFVSTAPLTLTPGQTATLTATINMTLTVPVVVTFTLGGTTGLVRGTDYTTVPASGSTITIAAGTTSATLTVTTATPSPPNCNGITAGTCKVHISVNSATRIPTALLLGTLAPNVVIN